jgi:hypothetical protein
MSLSDNNIPIELILKELSHQFFALQLFLVKYFFLVTDTETLEIKIILIRFGGTKPHFYYFFFIIYTHTHSFITLIEFRSIVSSSLSA